MAMSNGFSELRSLLAEFSAAFDLPILGYDLTVRDIRRNSLSLSTKVKFATVMFSRGLSQIGNILRHHANLA